MAEDTSRIKPLREKHGWSRKKLADLTGVHLRTITRLELGQTKPQKKKFERIMALLEKGPGAEAAAPKPKPAPRPKAAKPAKKRAVKPAAAKRKAKPAAAKRGRKPAAKKAVKLWEAYRRPKAEPTVLSEVDLRLINHVLSLNEKKKLALLIALEK